MRDLYHNLKKSVALNIAAITTNTTTVGATIDMQGFDAIDFSIQAGTLTDGAYAVQVFAGDASNMSDEAQITDATQILGSAPSFAATDDNVIKSFGVLTGKRYLRLKVVSTGVTTGGTLGAQALQGNAAYAPVV